jgi:hypothetical protein
MPHHDYSFEPQSNQYLPHGGPGTMPMTSPRRRTCFADDAELALAGFANRAALFTPGIFNPYRTSSLHQRGVGAAMWTCCNFNRVAYAGTHWPPDHDERRNQLHQLLPWPKGSYIDGMTTVPATVRCV